MKRFIHNPCIHPPSELTIGGLIGEGIAILPILVTSGFIKAKIKI